MKVHELIAILEDCDPEAEVLLATQPHYPLEFRLAGVTVREEMLDGSERGEDGDSDEEGGDDEGEGPFSEEPIGDGCRRNDVLLVEGGQLRYGDRDAWANPRTEA